MEILGVMILIIVTLALVGIISYCVYVYLQDKENITAKINSTNINLNKKIKNEQSNRLSNVKYVVDQVNRVNSDISTQFSSSNATIFKSLSTQGTAISSNLDIQNKQYSGLNTSIQGLQSNVTNDNNNINKIVTGFGQLSVPNGEV